MRFRAPSVGPRADGPAADGLGAAALAGALAATELGGAALGGLDGAGVDPPPQADTARTPAAKAVRTVLCRIRSPPPSGPDRPARRSGSRTFGNREIVLTVPDQADGLALEGKRVHRRGCEVLLGHDEVRPGVE